MAAMPRPDVLELTIAVFFTAGAILAKSWRFTSRSSTTASNTKSASARRLWSSSKLPTRIAAKFSSRWSGLGFRLRRVSRPLRATALRSGAGEGMSSSTTSRPWPATWAATWAPMVPAPSTATFLMSVLKGHLESAAADREGRSGRALVHPVDHVLVLALHHAALDLQGGSQLARLDRELAGDEGDLLDLLELGEAGGQVVDELLVEGHDLGLAQEVVPAARGQALLLRPLLEALEARHHESGREGPVVADHPHLGDVLVGLERGLEGLRGDVLPARGDEDVLLPVGDGQEAVLVEDADVAGVEPAFPVDGLRAGLRLLEAAPHDVGAAAQDLPVGCDPHLHPLDGQPHRSRLDPVGTVAGDDRARLGEAVALADEEPGRPEELRDLAGQRRPPGDEQAEPPARLDQAEIGK